MSPGLNRHPPARRLLPALGLAAIPVLLALFPDSGALLQWMRAGGGLLRGLSSHWVHWSASHLFWSGGTFLLLSIVAAREDPQRFFRCIAAASFAVSAAVWLGTTLDCYRGLSGIDSALFTMLAARRLQSAHRDGDRRQSIAMGLLLLLFAAKLVFECATGGALFVDGGTTMRPVPAAHAAGGAAGLLVSLAGDRRRIARFNPVT